MLLILSRLALKHDLEIRELQAATFCTMLVKHDEPSVQASKAATGLFVTKSKEEQRPTGEPHVHGWAAMMTAWTTDPALSSRRQTESGGIHVYSANSPETRRKRGAPKRSGDKTIFYASWRQERRTAIADFLATTKDAKYCTVECRRQQRRPAVVDLLDATKVISSPSSVCCAGPCRGIRLSRSSRYS